MNVAMAIAPHAEAVHIAEMKEHLKQDADITADDMLIAAQTAAAADVTETQTGSNCSRNRVMLATSFDLILDKFPAWNVMFLPRVPLVSVTSITYVDTAGTTQTLATTVYSVNAYEGRIYLAYGQVWPACRSSIEDKVIVRFIAGMAAPFTAATSDTCTVYGRTLTNGDIVKVLNSGGTLPAGLSASTIYYVVNVAGATFKLSLTSGGAAVDITGIGSGTHFIESDLQEFETLRCAIKLRVGQLYRNRGDGGGTAGSVDATMATIDAFVASVHA